MGDAIERDASNELRTVDVRIPERVLVERLDISSPRARAGGISNEPIQVLYAWIISIERLWLLKNHKDPV